MAVFVFDDGRRFEGLTPAEWRGFHPAFGADVMQVVTAQASVRGKRTPQSTQPEAVRAQRAELAEWRAAWGGGARASGPR